MLVTRPNFIFTSKVRSKAGHFASLSDIVDIVSRYGFSSITREDGQKLVNVTGDLSEEDPERAAFDLHQL